MILFLLQIYFNIFKKVFPLKKYDKKDVFSTKPDVLFSLWKIFPETQKNRPFVRFSPRRQKGPPPKR